MTMFRNCNPPVFFWSLLVLIFYILFFFLILSIRGLLFLNNFWQPTLYFYFLPLSSTKFLILKMYHRYSLCSRLSRGRGQPLPSSRRGVLVFGAPLSGGSGFDASLMSLDMLGLALMPVLPLGAVLAFGVPPSGGSGFDANVGAGSSELDVPGHVGSGFDHAHPSSQRGSGLGAPPSSGSGFDANVGAGGSTFDVPGHLGSGFDAHPSSQRGAFVFDALPSQWWFFRL
jgi:hypothetical protein